MRSRSINVFVCGLFCILFGLATPLFCRTMMIEDVLAIERLRYVMMSPDGQHIVYLKSGDLWVSDLSQEPVSSRKIIEDVSDPQWLDNVHILYLKKLSSGVSLCRYSLPKKTSQVLAKSAEAITHVRCSKAKNHIAVLIAHQVWVLDLKTDRFSKINTGTFNISSIDWAPDGERLVVSSGEKGYVLTLKTQHLSSLDVSASMQSPKWSSDGKWIYFLTTDGFKQSWLASSELAALEVKTGVVKRFKETGEQQLSVLYKYDEKSESIYYLVEEGFGYNLHRLSLRTGERFSVTRGSRIWTEFSFSEDLSKVAFILEDAKTPPELYVSSFPELSPQKISTSNDRLVTLDLGESELISWTNSEGGRIEGQIIKPVGYQQGKRYPMIMWLHGGPASCFSSRFANGTWHYPTQVLAAQGYVIFMPNPRGSTGYGTAFRRALMKRWGEVDYDDVMSGVSYLVNEKKLVDPDRMGVAGWSYGGYLASVVVSKTTQFKAASIGAGFSELMSLYATIDIPDWLEDYFVARPYESPDIFMKHSPIYAMTSVKTPVLIQHGENDARVPFTQAKLLYRALSHKKVPVRLEGFSEEEHVLKKTENKRKSMHSNVEWFNAYL